MTTVQSTLPNVILPTPSVKQMVTFTPPRLRSHSPVFINKIETVNIEEVEQLKFLLSQRDIEIKAWKKHAKHLEKHGNKGGNLTVICFI
jgi:hypothetical protein